MKCNVNIKIKKVECPGTLHLRVRHPVFVAVRLFGRTQHTHDVYPSFPMIYDFKLTFKRFFTNAKTPDHVLEILEDETIVIELKQRTKAKRRGSGCARTIARIEEPARRFLFPERSVIRREDETTRELLLYKTRELADSNILEPKLVFKTRTSFEENLSTTPQHLSTEHPVAPHSYSNRSESSKSPRTTRREHPLQNNAATPKIDPASFMYDQSERLYDKNTTFSPRSYDKNTTFSPRSYDKNTSLSNTSLPSGKMNKPTNGIIHSTPYHIHNQKPCVTFASSDPGLSLDTRAQSQISGKRNHFSAIKTSNKHAQNNNNVSNKTASSELLLSISGNNREKHCVCECPVLNDHEFCLEDWLAGLDLLFDQAKRPFRTGKAPDNLISKRNFETPTPKKDPLKIAQLCDMCAVPSKRCALCNAYVTIHGRNFLKYRFTPQLEEEEQEENQSSDDSFNSDDSQQPSRSFVCPSNNTGKSKISYSEPSHSGGNRRNGLSAVFNNSSGSASRSDLVYQTSDSNSAEKATQTVIKKERQLFKNKQNEHFERNTTVATEIVRRDEVLDERRRAREILAGRKREEKKEKETKSVANVDNSKFDFMNSSSPRNNDKQQINSTKISPQAKSFSKDVTFGSVRYLNEIPNSTPQTLTIQQNNRHKNYLLAEEPTHVENRKVSDNSPKDEDVHRRRILHSGRPHRVKSYSPEKTNKENSYTVKSSPVKKHESKLYRVPNSPPLDGSDSEDLETSQIRQRIKQLMLKNNSVLQYELSSSSSSSLSESEEVQSESSDNTGLSTTDTEATYKKPPKSPVLPTSAWYTEEHAGTDGTRRATFDSSLNAVYHRLYENTKKS